MRKERAALGKARGSQGDGRESYRNARGIQAEARGQLGEEQGNVPARDFCFHIHIFCFPTELQSCQRSCSTAARLLPVSERAAHEWGAIAIKYILTRSVILCVKKCHFLENCSIENV